MDHVGLRFAIPSLTGDIQVIYPSRIWPVFALFAGDVLPDAMEVGWKLGMLYALIPSKY